MTNRTSFPLLQYKNFSDCIGYSGFLRTVCRDFWLIYIFESEFYSLDVLALWGYGDECEILRIENLHKKYSDFSLKHDESTIMGILDKMSVAFRKNLETFMFVSDPCLRFYKIFYSAPRFFSFISMFVSSTFFFSYLRGFCSFVNYERKRQKDYLPLQIEELDKQLDLAAGVLDFFDKREAKPEIYFFLRELFDRLKCMSDAYYKIRFGGQKDIIAVYWVLRFIIINYSDIIKLMIFRIELDRYRRIAR